MAKPKSRLQKWPTWFKVAKIAAAGLTVMAFTTYLVGQQILRLGANDPQIQMAEDAARALNQDVSYGAVLPTNQIDIAKSLAPFMAIYDNQGNLLASSAVLDGNALKFPQGVFRWVAKNGEDRITWQPREGVRIASVVTAYNGGYIVAGRNLHQVENRIGTITKVIAFGWVMSLLLTAIGALVFF